MDLDSLSKARRLSASGHLFPKAAHVRRANSPKLQPLTEALELPSSRLTEIRAIVTVIRRQLAIAAVAITLTIGGGCAREGVPRMVEVHGYRVRMLLHGHGSPPVVFINVGFGGSYEIWDRVNPAISQFTRTVAYNRGGTWKSDPAPLPRDSQHIADELHIALRNAGIKPPYIVVGASLGGLHARVFAHSYPADIAGIVLLDPTSEDFLGELKRRNRRMWEEAEKQNAVMGGAIQRPKCERQE